MKNLIMITLALVALNVSGYALAVAPADFDRLIQDLQKEEYQAVETYLQDHKSELEKDPDYYVILLNYVMAKGMQTINVVAQGEAQPGDLQLSDPKTGKAVGFMGSRTEIDEALIVDGFRTTQKALKHFKQRLDIHFGIIAMSERLPRWDITGEQCVEVLRVSREIDNQWTWGPINSMDGDPKEFMIDNILNRTNKMFHADHPAADAALIKVSEELIKQYPELIYGYANLGVYYLVTQEYALAEKYLRQAEKIDPKDEIVQGNLLELEKRRNSKP